MTVLSVLGGLVLDDGRRWAEAATEWQRADAAALLADDGPRLHAWTRARGGGKTRDGAGCGIAGLLESWPPGARGYAFAVDQEQAALVLDAAAGLIHRSGLAGLLDVQSRRVLNRETGASLIVMSADSASAYGLLGHFWWVDEFSLWPQSHRGLWTAIVSSLVKVRDARLVVATTAGDPASWTAGVLRDARRSSRWRVSDVPGPLPWVSAEDLDEQRRLLLPSMFARLHLNVETAGEDRLTTVDDLRACVTHAGWLAPVQGARYVASLDMGYVHDRAVAAVCHRDGDGRVVLDRMEVWKGSRLRPVRESTVEEWLHEAWRAYRPSRLVLDPWQTKGLAQRLRARGVRVEEFAFSSQSVGRLALGLYRLLREHAVALPDEEELLDELASVRLRETAPGVYRLDHDSGQHDDRAVALALCAQTLTRRASGGEASGVTAAGRPVPSLSGPAAVVTYSGGRAAAVGEGDWRLAHARRMLGRR